MSARSLATVAAVRRELAAPGYKRTIRVCVYGPVVDGSRATIATVEVGVGALRRSVKALSGTQRLACSGDIEPDADWQARIERERGPDRRRNMRIWIY